MAPLWLITGCSSGFGFSLARLALSKGHRVIATSRNPSKTPSLMNQITSKGGIWLPFDVTWPRSRIQSTVGTIESEHGPIDILVNNAGYALLGPAEDLSEEPVRLQMETNFFGPFFLTQALIPEMRQRRSGTIINFSSIGGLRNIATSTLYGSSKFAVEGFSEALAKEVTDFNIRVIIVEPGAFRSDFLTGGNLKLGELSDAYKGTASETVIKMFQEMDGKQPGNVEKGCQRIYEVIMGEGMAKDLDLGKFVPLRLPLGDDALKQTHTKLDTVKENLSVLEGIAKATAHE